MERIAVLDLGSNSFNLLVVDARSGAAQRPIAKHKESVRLADGLTRGSLGPAAIARADRALEVLVSSAQSYQPDRIVAVATSAFREAANGRALARELGLKYGLSVEVLDGAEEARLCYLGARTALPPLPGPIATLDVGGGSVEVSVGQDELLLLTESLPIGVLRLRELIASPRGVVESSEVTEIAARVRACAARTSDDVRLFKPHVLVLTGGTSRRLAQLVARPPLGHADPSVLYGDALLDLVTDRIGADPEGLAARGIRPERRDLIAPGAVLVATLMRMFGADPVLVVGAGLRQGVVVREQDPRAARVAMAAPFDEPILALG